MNVLWGILHRTDMGIFGLSKNMAAVTISVMILMISPTKVLKSELFDNCLLNLILPLKGKIQPGE